jgi:hypothetical protein
MPRGEGPVVPSPRAGMAMVRGHVELPDAELLGALLEADAKLRLEAFALGGLALDRDQLVIDKAAKPGLEDAQFFR